MTLLLTIGRWLLSGGWKYASMGLLAIALLFYRADAHSWRKAYDAQRSAYVAAQAEATLRQMAAIQATEARYRAIATQVDTDHAKALASADSASDRFIHDHAVSRVCAADSRQAGQPAAAAQGLGSNVPAITAGSALVAIEPADVKLCAENYTYARSAYDWGQGLIRDGLAN